MVYSDSYIHLGRPVEKKRKKTQLVLHKAKSKEIKTHYTYLTGASVLLFQDTAAQVTVTLPQHEACSATPIAALQTVPLPIQEMVVVDEAVWVGLDPIQPSLPCKPL